MFAPRSHPLITIAAIVMEASGEAVLCRDLRRDARMTRGATRLARLDAWLLSVLRQALPHLFTHLRALLPLTLLRLQALQLALLRACQPPVLCSLLELLLRLLRAPIGAFLAL